MVNRSLCIASVIRKTHAPFDAAHGFFVIGVSVSARHQDLLIPQKANHRFGTLEFRRHAHMLNLALSRIKECLHPLNRRLQQHLCRKGPLLLGVQEGPFHMNSNHSSA